MIMSRFRSTTWLQYLAALLITALVSGVIALIRTVVDVSNASMLYLLAVLGSAVLFGSGPAILASLAAFFAFNFLFVQPHYTLIVSDEEQWVALALLLVTGVVTGQLAAALRDRAQQAERREKEAIVLYDAVRLMGEPYLKEALRAVAERIRLELALDGALIVFGGQGLRAAEAEAGDRQALELARSALRSSETILSRGSTPTESERGAPGRWIRVIAPTAGQGRSSDRTRTVPVQVAGLRAGAIVLVRKPGSPGFTTSDDRLLSAVSNQLGLALERVRLQQEATEAEVLRRTDELRTALLKAVSHDLRTPLSSIIASAGSLLQEDVPWTEQEKREFTQAIVDEAQRLNRLVGNLLDLSRIEAGSIRPDKGWYDLASLAAEVAGRLGRQAGGHRIILDVPDDLPPVHCDYVAIDQVLSNLIENATRYTPPGADIQLSIRVRGEEAELEVADNGPGIPVEALPHLFKPFYRVLGADPGAPGSGLGLAIARGLVEAHGGRIWVENRPQGGARFVFTLPLTERPVSIT
jgi:two-component system sensor histidine kinase KdpD